MTKKYETREEAHEAVLTSKRKSFWKAELIKWKIAIPPDATYEQLEDAYRKECDRFHTDPDILHDALKVQPQKREPIVFYEPTDERMGRNKHDHPAQYGQGEIEVDMDGKPIKKPEEEDKKKSSWNF